MARGAASGGPSAQGSGLSVFDDVAKPCRSLSRKCTVMRHCLKAIGAPVIRRRQGGFEGLFRIIVEQQVSVPSAQAIWGRTLDRVDVRDPCAVLLIGEEGLKACGISGPKARYISGLAADVAEARLPLGAIAGASDDEASSILQAVKGIGPWTAAIYLLFCEGRVDIWPSRDVALRAAYNKAANAELTQQMLDEGKSGDWGPYRGVAAHVLWTYYAHIRGRTPI